MSLAFWAESQSDFKAAWEKYLQFLKLAGTKTFVDLVAGAKLQSPFAEGCLAAVASAAVSWLDGNPVEDK
jgi:oligoendopeptidase F